jgi:hypothetical protein
MADFDQIYGSFLDPFELLAVQLCSALGVNVVATGGSEEKLEVVRQQCLGEGRWAVMAITCRQHFHYVCHAG